MTLYMESYTIYAVGHVVLIQVIRHVIIIGVIGHMILIGVIRHVIIMWSSVIRRVVLSD